MFNEKEVNNTLSKIFKHMFQLEFTKRRDWWSKLRGFLSYDGICTCRKRKHPWTNLISVLLMFSVIQHQCPQSVNCVEAIIRAFKQVDFKTFGVPVAKVERYRIQNTSQVTTINP